MAKSEFVTRKFTPYVPGMENDFEFEAVSFRRKISDAAFGIIKLTNKEGAVLSADICKKYNVKPIGAVAPSGLKGINKAYVLALIDAAKKMNMTLEVAIEKYNTKFPEHGLTLEKAKEIQKNSAQAAKDLLAD